MPNCISEIISRFWYWFWMFFLSEHNFRPFAFCSEPDWLISSQMTSHDLALTKLMGSIWSVAALNRLRNRYTCSASSLSGYVRSNYFFHPASTVRYTYLFPCRIIMADFKWMSNVPTCKYYSKMLCVYRKYVNM